MKKKPMKTSMIVIISVFAAVLITFILMIALEILVTKIRSSQGTMMVQYDLLEPGLIGEYNISSEDLSANTNIKKWIEEAQSSNENYHILLNKTTGDGILFIKNSNYILENEYTMENTGDGDKAIINVTETKYKDTFGYDFIYIQLEKELEDITLNFNSKQVGIQISSTEEEIGKKTWR
ncbi:MAG: hypothetical protein IKL73_04755 [Lachnospiraceae bacterium]|nr:hypothetical protein [Lachnospiraceae bacterium]